MSHPNEYPGKTFVPFEGDMPVETVELPFPGSDREGITTVTGPEGSPDRMSDEFVGIINDAVHSARFNMSQSKIENRNKRARAASLPLRRLIAKGHF
jgi:hypothetical protein